MSKKLKFKVISCSSQQPDFPSSSLLFGGQNGGWQTKRFCTYPQQVTFEFYGPVKIDKIQIISDNRKISSQVDILFYMPFQINGRQSQERFQKYGYLNFNRNQNTQLREQKSIMVDIKCLYLRFLFHKPYASKQNFFSQIGIHQISIYGTDTNSSLAPIEKLPRQYGGTIDSYGYTGDEDPFVVEKLALLNAQKQRAVQNQEFQHANVCKEIIEQVKRYGQELKKMHYDKRIAIENEDYEQANKIKKSIEQQRKQLDELVSSDNFENDPIMEQNQFNQPALNDFQDNEFVDPQMNEMISKSGIYSSKGQNSRIAAGNSRLKINKTLLKKENQKQKEKENYDERVIPAIANKTKTEESQIVQEEKKDIPIEEIDGKFIQYAIVLQEHFQEEIVKKFFSRHWQHKFDALGAILTESKNKKNVDSSFIKALIIVVKNSASQVNFQVALSTLQLFGDMLKLNAKGNLLSRTNELSNDLDTISKQIIKKMSDNNNKLKQQAEKSFSQMITSSLYGPEVCVIAMAKSKQKVKFSSKQLLSRLVQVQKIVQRNGNNQQIIMIASDFAIENVKNPAAQVRNEALNLLMLCKDKDSSKLVEKKISDKNMNQLIEAHQNKAGSKSPQKESKVKRNK